MTYVCHPGDCLTLLSSSADRTLNVSIFRVNTEICLFFIFYFFFFFSALIQDDSETDIQNSKRIP